LSHLKERKETNCLNCNAQVQGHYCHICGQENVEPKESVWHLVNHFFQDITHFDGKFFSSLKYLITKPGFLSKEYMAGRRASYLNPIRMYIFTSAFFFLIFFGFYKKNELPLKISTSATEMFADLRKNRASLLDSLKTVLPERQRMIIEDKLKNIEGDISLLERDSTATDKLKSIDYSFNAISFDKESTKKYKTSREYDSVQNALPKNRRDGFIRNKMERQNLHLKEKYKNDGRAMLRGIAENFIQRFPQILFVSLPLFALLLRLLYLRRKDIFYVNHAILAIHVYCAVFIIILAGLWAGSVFTKLGSNMPGWLNTILALSGFFYIYKSLRNFYQQRRAKTIFKYMLFLFLLFILMLILFTGFFIFSTFTI
jgi:Protein of unknown function (DUF3667)